MGGNHESRCFDNARDPINLDGGHGFISHTANYGAETRDANTKIDFLSNGFKIKCSHAGINANDDFAYAAFAENPFISSKGVPTTAR